MALVVGLVGDGNLGNLFAGFGAVAGRVVDVQSETYCRGRGLWPSAMMPRMSRKIPHISADNAGNFFLTDLPPGTYVIAASEGAGQLRILIVLRSQQT